MQKVMNNGASSVTPQPSLKPATQEKVRQTAIPILRSQSEGANSKIGGQYGGPQLLATFPEPKLLPPDEPENLFCTCCAKSIPEDGGFGLQ